MVVPVLRMRDGVEVRLRTALCDRDPRAADRVRVELYDGLDHLEAASDERLYSAALEWLIPGEHP